MFFKVLNLNILKLNYRQKSSSIFIHYPHNTGGQTNGKGWYCMGDISYNSTHINYNTFVHFILLLLLIVNSIMIVLARPT